MAVYQKTHRPRTVSYSPIDLDDVDLLAERDQWRWWQANWQAGALDGPETGAYINYRLAEIEAEIERRQRFRLTRPDGARRYRREFLDGLRAHTDLVALIQNQGGDLRRVGADHYRGTCPWCEGSRPDTLSVNTEKQLWHCFRCGLGGDAIAWHQLMGRLSFEQAIEGLAAVVGVEAPPPPRIEPARTNRRRIVELHYAGAGGDTA